VTAGEQLRKIREALGLSVRAVEAASARIAERHGNQDYAISISRLSDIETKGVLPNIFRLYSLSVIYREDYHEILRMYGICFENAAADLDLAPMPVTRPVSIFRRVSPVNVPVRLDPAFHPDSTTSIGRMIMAWGTAPLSYLSKFTENRNFTYGYIGENDLTMYPLLLPGSFVQIDESKQKISSGPWASEYERPIYFLETREGYMCCWCELNNRMLTLVPHPLSTVRMRTLRIEAEVEVLGQVVGVAMRLSRRGESDAAK
jgi:transcriptional regulator with XRE-family HTH domain